METKELQKQSGVTNVSRVMDRLVTAYGERFAAAIRLPHRKGNGGYAAKVQPFRGG
jgi:hypothetical protein